MSFFLQLVEANQRNAHLAADLADAHRLLAVAQQQAGYWRAAHDGEHRLPGQTPTRSGTPTTVRNGVSPPNGAPPTGRSASALGTDERQTPLVEQDDLFGGAQ